MTPKRPNSGDRAAETRTTIGVADGIFGAELEIEATADGLEFGGGYSTLPWEWIFSAFRTAHSRADEGAANGK